MTTPQIFNSTSTTSYTYLGCYNETTALPNTTHARALADGANTVGAGTMTPEICLAFCAGKGAAQPTTGSTQTTVYKYAGLEYSRECWCAQELSALSARLADGECGDGCDGNGTEVCGGDLKLSVYIYTSASSAIRRVAMFGVLAWAALVLMTTASL